MAFHRGIIFEDVVSKKNAHLHVETKSTLRKPNHHLMKANDGASDTTMIQKALKVLVEFKGKSSTHLFGKLC